MVTKPCIQYIHNGFMTGSLLSIIFFYKESYLCCLLLGIWCGLILGDKAPNLNHIQQIQKCLYLHNKATILINFFKARTYKPKLKRMIDSHKFKKIICIQKNFRRWLVEQGSSGFYPKHLELCVKCEWIPYIKEFYINNIDTTTHNIILLERDNYNLINKDDFIKKGILKKKNKIWLVPNYNHKLSRYSVLLFGKSCRKKKCFCWKCRYNKKFKKLASKYYMKHPETIKKIKKNDILLSYKHIPNINKKLIIKWGVVLNNPHHPSFPTIKL